GGFGGISTFRGESLAPRGVLSRYGRSIPCVDVSRSALLLLYCVGMGDFRRLACDASRGAGLPRLVRGPYHSQFVTPSERRTLAVRRGNALCDVPCGNPFLFSNSFRAIVCLSTYRCSCGGGQRHRR